MRLEIVGNHDGNPSTKLRTSHGGPYLLTEDISRPSRCQPTIEPAITPVDQTKAVDLAVITGRLDQPLPSSAFARPEAREGRMKGKLYFVEAS